MSCAIIASDISFSLTRMNILFLHQNFPGQFRHIAAYLAQQPGYQVVAIGKKTAPGMEGVRLIRYELHREPSKQAHHSRSNGTMTSWNAACQR
jgi:hypothetical protein